MTEEVFAKALPVNSRLSSRTVDAARAVLVEGRRQVDVANELGMQRQAVGRAVSKILDRAGELGLPVLDLAESGIATPEVVREVERARDASRVMAITEARKRFGEHVQIQEARPGCLYEGRVELRMPQHIVQNVGPASYVLHDLSHLERVPQIGAGLIAAIRYPRDQAMASVSEKEPSMGRGRGGLSM